MALICKSERVEIPHEPGNYLMLRPLSGAQLDDAAQAQQGRALGLVAKLPAGFDLSKLAEWKAQRNAAAELEKAAATRYDAAKLVEHGLTGWDGPLYCDEAGKTYACNADTKSRMLDGQTRDWAARQIEDMSARPTTSGSDSGAS